MTQAIKENEKRLATKELSPAQQRHIAYIVTEIRVAQLALDAAKKQLELAQNNADSFIVYCAEENKVALGVDGWSFAQQELKFVQFAAPHLNGNGKQ